MYHCSCSTCTTFVSSCGDRRLCPKRQHSTSSGVTRAILFHQFPVSQPLQEMTTWMCRNFTKRRDFLSSGGTQDRNLADQKNRSKVGIAAAGVTPLANSPRGKAEAKKRRRSHRYNKTCFRIYSAVSRHSPPSSFHQENLIQNPHLLSQTP